MTLMRYVTILCDYCGDESNATWSALDTRKKAKGWIRVDKKDMCPDCAKGKLGEANSVERKD